MLSQIQNCHGRWQDCSASKAESRSPFFDRPTFASDEACDGLSSPVRTVGSRLVQKRGVAQHNQTIAGLIGRGGSYDQQARLGAAAPAHQKTARWTPAIFAILLPGRAGPWELLVTGLDRRGNVRRGPSVKGPWDRVFRYSIVYFLYYRIIL